MLIAQMTDIHIGFEKNPAGEEPNHKLFREAMDRLLAQPNTPDMLVLSGDVTDRGDEGSYAKLAALVAPCPFPVHVMMGNHDDRENLVKAFPDTPVAEGGFLHRAFLAEGLLVVLLDTFEAGRHGGAFCDLRRQWLTATLAAHAGVPTLIIMHHPPLVSGIAWMDPHPNDKWIANFAAAIEGYEPQIQAIHCGHLHRSVITKYKGIPLSVTPSVAPPVALDLRPISWERPDNRALITSEPPVYALHRWNGDQLVSHYEVVSDWTVIAAFGPHLQGMIHHMEEEQLASA